MRLLSGPPKGFPVSYAALNRNIGRGRVAGSSLGSYEWFVVGHAQFGDFLMDRRIFCRGVSENGENGLVGRAWEHFVLAPAFGPWRSLCFPHATANVAYLFPGYISALPCLELLATCLIGGIQAKDSRQTIVKDLESKTS